MRRCQTPFYILPITFVKSLLCLAVAVLRIELTIERILDAFYDTCYCKRQTSLYLYRLVPAQDVKERFIDLYIHTLLDSKTV